MPAGAGLDQRTVGVSALLAARLVGTLDEVEAAVDAVTAAGSVAKAAETVHLPTPPHR